jgi:hypothetical protein
MTSIVTAIRNMIKQQKIRPTPPTRNLFEVEETSRVGVEQESSLNIRLHKVANGWVVNVMMENSVGHESETHVCSSTDNVIDKVNEILAMYKLQS